MFNSVENHSAVCIFRKVSKTAGSGGGAGDLGPTSPLPLLSRFRCVSTPQETLTYIKPPAHHAGPRGRRTSTACGSCRRPLKSCEKQGIEGSNGANKKYCTAIIAIIARPHGPGRRFRVRHSSKTEPGQGARERRVAQNGLGGGLEGWGANKL